MRLFVLFDLPVKTKRDRRLYQKFHNFLVKDGYDMLQLSVYMRVTNGFDGVETHLARLRRNLPPRGNVRAMVVTEKQYARMLVLVGEPTVQEKTVGDQLQLWL